MYDYIDLEAVFIFRLHHIVFFDVNTFFENITIHCPLPNHDYFGQVLEKRRELEIGMRHGGITGFYMKIGRDSEILEPGTDPSLL